MQITTQTAATQFKNTRISVQFELAQKVAKIVKVRYPRKSIQRSDDLGIQVRWRVRDRNQLPLKTLLKITNLVIYSLTRQSKI